MAAALFLDKPVFKTVVEDLLNKSIGSVRYSSKKGSRGVGSADHGRPSHFGIKKNSGSFVNANTILYHQCRLQFAPGLNVGLGRFAKLYAKVPGKVVVSCEKTNFKSDYIVDVTFPHYPPAYRKYMNVIPEPMHTRFKLVEKF